MRKTEVKIRMLASLALAFGMMGLYFLFLHSRFSFIYDINDDVAMRNVAAGVITGTPDAHLIHVKYVLGLVISGLYAVLPGLDWYSPLMTSPSTYFT